jgi:hypothetical protein
MQLSPGIRWPSKWLLHLVLLLSICGSVAARAEDTQATRRAQIGTRLLPAVVAADQELASKRSADGQIQVVLLYREDADAAAEAANRLAATRRIKDFPVRITQLPYTRLGELSANPPAALFIAEWAPEELPAVVRFGIEHHRLVFSPFEGDVGAGAQTGIFIGDRIVPLVNLKALQAAGIQLKPFFLEVAKTHE